ncbi:MAG: aldehyde ferredoxin oxidoreductase N-terminal domain-containing protein [Candidatus Aegiribacteria sp.]
MNYGGYAGKLLRVDLGRGTVEKQDTSDYLPDWYGGRALAARIAWDEIPPGTGAFDPASPLMILTGPLTGTAAPCSGRTTVCGISAQGYPVEWYSRSSFGGHWGPQLKHAGFDGIIVTGRAPGPVFLRVENGSCSIEDASRLWGMGIYRTQKTIMEELGKDWRVFAIGPAGENLVRIAVAATETESASGQGGYGAVMGSKNLKAVAVRGTLPIGVARPREFIDVCRLIRNEVHASHGWPHVPKLDPEKVRKYGQRYQACTQGCAVRCYDARFYTTVPAVLGGGRTLSGQVDCIAGLFPGIPGTSYDWKLGFEAGFEIGRMANDEGLNHWEILVGLVPWLRALRDDGELSRVDGMEIDLDSPKFWSFLLRGISRREGEFRSALSEGTVRGCRTLGLGGERLEEFFPAWGYAGHWDGHGDRINYVFFPYWTVSALQWAMDTRDPISSAHGYVQNIMGWSRVCSPEHGLSWKRIMEVSSRVYGSERCADPESGYEGKAFPAFWHGRRSVMKDSLTVGDQVFPRIYSRKTADNFAGAGDMEGPSFERHMFGALTGITWSDDEMDHASERVIQLERALLVRNFGRSRADDESVIPYFERTEQHTNPLTGRPVGMDRKRFEKVLDEYYALRGWDRKTGRPTVETLNKFGLRKEAERIGDSIAGED